MAETHQLDPSGVVEAVCQGIEEGQQDFDIKVGLIGILSRTYGVDNARIELEALASRKDHLSGLDLAGDEEKYPAELFLEHFWRARDLGWQITIHAGESAGSGSIWTAVEELGADRVGHAVMAIQDPVLMEYLAAQRVGVECNLTSNVQTSTVPDYQSHPIKEFMQNGILATLNTDDPGISAIDLAYEYNIAAPKAGLSIEQIQRAQRNALEIAFLSDGDKLALRQMKTGRLNSSD
jgi:adenosine deaminase